MLKMPSESQENTVYTFDGPEEDVIKHNILVTIESQLDISDLERSEISRGVMEDSCYV